MSSTLFFALEKKIMTVWYIRKNIFEKSWPPLDPSGGDLNSFNATLTRFGATWLETLSLSENFPCAGDFEFERKNPYRDFSLYWGLWVFGFAPCSIKKPYPELRLLLRLRSGLWPQTKLFQKILEKEKGPPFTFSWFQSCCGWRLRLTANRKLAVAVAVGIFDRNSGYEKMIKI